MNVTSTIVAVVTCGMILGTVAVAAPGAVETDFGSDDASIGDGLIGTDGETAAAVTDMTGAATGLSIVGASESDDRGSQENQRGPECKDEGDPVSVGVAGEGTDDRGGSNDNVVDVNVLSDSSHASDCDTVDVSVASHDRGGADDDTADVTALGRSSYGSSEDFADITVASDRSTAGHDNDVVDVDVASSTRSGHDDDEVDVSVASDSRGGHDDDTVDVSVASDEKGGSDDDDLAVEVP